MSIYESIYEIFSKYIYDYNVPVGSYQELVCILVSTAACLFVFSIPFIIVFRIIKLFV